MKRIAFLFGLVGILLTVTAQAQTVTLPPDVSGYYRSYNFAAAYSTLPERLQLAGMMKTPELLSARHQKVIEHLRTVQRSETPDRSIVLGRLQNLPFVGPQLIEVADIVRQSVDRITISVRVYDLEPETNHRMVATFENRLSNPLFQLDRRTVMGTEIHEWKQVNGHWLRSPASLRLLRD